MACFKSAKMLLCLLAQYTVADGRRLWEAKATTFDGWSFAEKQSLMGVLESTLKDEADRQSGRAETKSAIDLPTSFDWRISSPTCIHSVRDQGKCGACWAEAATEVFSDRLCIHSNGSTNVVLSPLYLIACDKKEKGCAGGFPEKAWEFLSSTGVYSDSCIPYNLSRSLLCPLSKCQDGSPLRNQTKYKVHSDALHKYAVLSSHIKEELFTNGPVEAVFTVYEDFMSYSGGVYHHIDGTGGKKLGLHAVKVLGWGTVANGTGTVPFWICANSW